MNKDYQFLIGRRFTVAGEIYVVSDLEKDTEHTFVKAHASDDRGAEDGLREILISEAHIATSVVRTFQLRDVIQGLLVDEEIVLFNPTIWHHADTAAPGC